MPTVRLTLSHAVRMILRMRSLRSLRPRARPNTIKKSRVRRNAMGFAVMDCAVLDIMAWRLEMRVEARL